MTEPKSTKKIPKEEPVEGVPPIPEGLDIGELLNSPIAKSLMEGCKDMFKKEKSDPDVCEIYIKAPSETVLKLFKIKE